MPRTANPDSQHKVSVHPSNGYRYASTQPARMNPFTGKKGYHHIHWGSLDENRLSGRHTLRKKQG